MAVRSFPIRACVLRKTKLGESDLILTFLTSEGSIVRAVAKGARKPKNPFASRLDLFSVADVLLHEGRNLHVVGEVRLCKAHDALRATAELSLAASVFAELMSHLAQEGLENERYYPLIDAAFEALCSLEEEQDVDRLQVGALALCAAYSLKALAFSGLRPALDVCANCGGTLADGATKWQAFSALEGGMLCSRCKSSFNHVLVKDGLSLLMMHLLFARFGDVVQGCLEAPKDGTSCAPPFSIAGMQVSRAMLIEALRLEESLIRCHVGARIKSLDVFIDFLKD